jgi:hypothetical protein
VEKRRRRSERKKKQLINGTKMLRGFFSICNSIISDDFCNYDAIILENFSTTLLLGFSMLVMFTPLLQGFLVPPEGN